MVGRAAGTESFPYSPAFKTAMAGKKWDAATLDTWLTDPKAMVPGTEMTFVGIKDKAARDAVIAYLATLK